MAFLAVDSELVESACRGDHRARERLMDSCLPTVLGWCLRLGGPKVDAEDAAHDVCVVVLTKLDALRDSEAFASWVYGVTRRILAKHRRRAWVQRWTGSSVPDVADDGPDPSSGLELSDLSSAVQGILERMPGKQREVLVLCDVEDRTDVEVATLLEVPVGTVKSRLRTARQRFRQSVRGHRVEPQLIGLTTWGQG
jgi:RNA polymerase sigma-70 factor (ECF subfamily)